MWARPTELLSAMVTLLLFIFEAVLTELGRAPDGLSLPELSRDHTSLYVSRVTTALAKDRLHDVLVPVLWVLSLQPREIVWRWLDVDRDLRYTEAPTQPLDVHRQRGLAQETVGSVFPRCVDLPDFPEEKSDLIDVVLGEVAALEFAKYACLVDPLMVDSPNADACDLLIHT